MFLKILFTQFGTDAIPHDLHKSNWLQIMSGKQQMQIHGDSEVFRKLLVKVKSFCNVTPSWWFDTKFLEIFLEKPQDGDSKLFRDLEKKLPHNSAVVPIRVIYKTCRITFQVQISTLTTIALRSADRIKMLLWAKG